MANTEMSFPGNNNNNNRDKIRQQTIQVNHGINLLEPGTKNYLELNNRPKIEGHTLNKENTAQELGLQKELNWDLTPEKGSSNPVTSDGIYKAIKEKNDNYIEFISNFPTNAPQNTIVFYIGESQGPYIKNHFYIYQNSWKQIEIDDQKLTAITETKAKNDFLSIFGTEYVSESNYNPIGWVTEEEATEDFQDIFGNQ